MDGRGGFMPLEMLTSACQKCSRRPFLASFCRNVNLKNTSTKAQLLALNSVVSPD